MNARAFNERLGSAIRTGRHVRSQEHLAEQMRQRGHETWSQSTVWAVEKGDRAVRAVELSALAEILGANIADLIPDVTSSPVTVFEHFVTESTDRDRRKSVRSVCGKVWVPDAASLSMGRCPDCVAIVDSLGWIR